MLLGIAAYTSCVPNGPMLYENDLFDNFVEKIQMMGTEDATTCHMAILRHTGKSHGHSQISLDHQDSSTYHRIVLTNSSLNFGR